MIYLNSAFILVPMISCILLSAGESRRFGSPKALAPIGKNTAVEYIQNILLVSPVDEIIIVLGAHLQEIKPYVFNHKKVRFVYNKDYKLGQTSSFQAGISCISKNSAGIMLFPVDYPYISAKSLEEIIRIFKINSPPVLIPVFKGQRGHPPIFNASIKHDILNLGVQQGVNTLFTRHTPMTVELNDAGIVKTFNTPEEFKGLF